MTDYTNGLEADYWDEDPDTESFTHKTLADAVELYVDRECGVAPRPRPVWTPPPGYVIGQVSHSSEEMRIAGELAPDQEDRKTEFLECLRVLSRRSFFAFKRSTVEEPLIKSIAEDLAERTLEVWLDELLDPDVTRSADTLLQKRLVVAFVGVLRSELQQGQWRPWTYEQGGQVTLTAVQMEAMMREHCPHWF